MTCHLFARISLLLLALALAAPQPAAARSTSTSTSTSSFSIYATGVVHGRILFYNDQGNFCPDTRDCTDAHYTEDEFNVRLPVRHARVVLKSDTGQVIGQSSTDANGWFRIGWTGPLGTDRGHIEWYPEHKDGRFSVRSATGARWVFWTYNRSLSAGTTKFAPQELGSYTWGSASSPHALANLYDGAYRMWADSLVRSNRMQTSFTGIQIRAFDAARCPTSCATSENQVIIDSAASTFMPQSRVMHELGHVATRLSKSYSFCGDYSRDGANSGWNLTSGEFACASFNEGIATFFGDRAIYGPDNPEPHTCISADACADGSFDVEANSRVGGCSTNETRSALSVVRYLRDLYDTTDDGETNALGFGDFFDALAAFPSGNGEKQANEPWLWNGSAWSLDDRDGRSARDLRGHIESQESFDSADAYRLACSPVGDF